MQIPLNVVFFNPDALPMFQMGQVLKGIGLEREYANDEQIDNQLRSVMFQVPTTRNPGCLDGPGLPQCFKTVQDVGAFDVMRARDHGMPLYDQMRQAFGLQPKTTFESVTGEESEDFPADPMLKAGQEINDPHSLDFVKLLNANGKEVKPGTGQALENVVTAVRRTPVAARLKAIYGSVDKMDAFVGMQAEKHVAGAELGPLEMAIWKKQFEALRDGDRFFYLNDPGLSTIKKNFGIDFHSTLGDIIARNTDVPRGEMAGNVFMVKPEKDGDSKAADSSAKDSSAKKKAKDSSDSSDKSDSSANDPSDNDSKDSKDNTATRTTRSDLATVPLATPRGRRRRRGVR